jgi:tryptophan 7-halogenase
VKVAILGSGSAGVMAVAHLSRHFPQFEILHVFDPRNAPLGVGEGTTPGFRVWLEEIAPGSFTSLQKECHATTKRGVQFENWGASTEPFCHDFVPQDNVGLHIAATRLPSFLEPFHQATRVNGRVARIRRNTGGVTLEMEKGPELSAGLVIDARGFPSTLGVEHRELTWIPTNAALVTRGVRVEGLERTRAVARPHGWVFVIPLSKYTSYGYVYGDDTASIEQVEADFFSFLSSEGVDPTTAYRNLRFPNFVRHEVFDGQVFRIGNAASFIEPLEATSIALIRTELILLSSWLRVFESSTRPRMAGALVASLNQSFRQTVIEVSLFIAWHYAHGSAFDTPFWTSARRRFQHGLREGVPSSVRASFEEQRERASELSAGDVVRARTRADLDHMLRRQTAFPTPFGGMTPLGFVQVAEGLGSA